MKRRTATTLALSLIAPLAFAACSAAPPTPPLALFTGPWTAMAIGAAAGPIAFAQRHGPTVTLVNRSDTAIDARVWIAKVDVSKPEGYDYLHTEDRLTVRVQPNQLVYTDVGRNFWVTGNHDAMVWIRLIPAVADDAMNAPLIDGAPGVIGTAADRPAIDPVWLQLDRPGPYKIEITGTLDPSAPDAGLAFHPLEKTTFSRMPRAAWMEQHDGKYPIATGGGMLSNQPN